jgi:pimeloyl-ACP methyl ester carboxylesterase
MMEKLLDYKGSSIHYFIEGKGTPLVLLHGFGEDHTIFKNQVDFLKEHCQVFVPDLPGSGTSDLLKSSAPSVEEMADSIHDLLLAENILACIMLGHSMGGYITLAFAEKYPEMLTGFGLVHSTAFEDNEEKKETRRKGIEAIKKYGAYSFLKNTTPNLFSTKFKQAHPEQLEALIEKGKEFTNEALAYYYTAMIQRPDRTSVLKNSKVPVLFIIGTEDIATPLKDLLEQVHLPVISHIHILAGVGHMGMLESPSAVNNHVLHFIQNVSS